MFEQVTVKKITYQKKVRNTHCFNCKEKSIQSNMISVKIVQELFADVVLAFVNGAEDITKTKYINILIEQAGFVLINNLDL